MAIDIGQEEEITFTTTYIKFGSSPNNADDFDAYAASGASSVSGSTSYTNQTVVYVWSNSNLCGQIKINDVVYIGGTTYDTAVAIELTGDYDILLGRGNVSSGGVSND